MIRPPRWRSRAPMLLAAKAGAVVAVAIMAAVWSAFL